MWVRLERLWYKVLFFMSCFRVFFFFLILLISLDILVIVLLVFLRVFFSFWIEVLILLMVFFRLVVINWLFRLFVLVIIVVILVLFFFRFLVIDFIFLREFVMLLDDCCMSWLSWVVEELRLAIVVFRLCMVFVMGDWFFLLSRV